MILGVVTLLALAQPVQDTTRLSLEDAVRLALDHAPSLQAARHAQAEAAGGVREAKGDRRPGIAAEGTVFRFEEPMIVAPIHGFVPGLLPEFDQTLVQGSVGMGWTLFDGGIRGGRVVRATALEDAAAAQTALTTQSMIAAVIRGYAGVISAEQQVTAQHKRLAALDAELVRVTRLLEQGRAAPLEQLRARAARATAAADSAGAAARLMVAEAALARLVGVAPDRVAAGRLQPVNAAAEAVAPRDAVLAQARAASPALRAAEARHAAAVASVRVAAGAWLPSLRLEGRVVTYGSGSGDYSTEWQSGVRVSWPIFTGGARSAAVDRARAAASGAEAALRDAELTLGNEVDQALAALAESERRVEALDAAVAALTEAQRIEALALAQGAGTQTDFLRAEADLAQARAGLAQAQAARIAARAELAALTGTLSLAGLERVVGGE